MSEEEVANVTSTDTLVPEFFVRPRYDANAKSYGRLFKNKWNDSLVIFSSSAWRGTMSSTRTFKLGCFEFFRCKSVWRSIFILYHFLFCCHCTLIHKAVCHGVMWPVCLSWGHVTWPHTDRCFLSPVCAAEVEPPLSGVRRSVSLSCSATRAKGLCLHGDMRCLAGTAVAAGGLRMMTSHTFLFQGQSGFIDEEFCIFLVLVSFRTTFMFCWFPVFVPVHTGGGGPNTQTRF